MPNRVTQARLLHQGAQPRPGNLNLKPVPDLRDQLRHRHVRVFGFRFRDKLFDRGCPFGGAPMATFQQDLPGLPLRQIPRSEPSQGHDLELQAQRPAHALGVFTCGSPQQPLFFPVSQVFTLGERSAHGSSF